MPGPAVLEVLDPGLLTTVQDGGRPELATEGITRGGAADRWSLAVANALVGNPADAAALELTIAGPTLRPLRAITVGLAGTIGGRIPGRGLAVAPGTAVTLQPGDTLHLDGPATGARGYLAVPGGVDVPVVLGSRSTALGAGFGGLEGRPLRAGDRIRATAPDDALVRNPARWPTEAAPAPGPIRVLLGPHATDLGAGASRALLAGPWAVGPASDRMGIRLAGRPIPGDAYAELPSLGVVEGSVQLPPDGLPIVLLADHQPTGGYPVIAVVITADLDRLAQLPPGAPIQLAMTTLEAARTAREAPRESFAAGVAALRADAGWDELWLSAGA